MTQFLRYIADFLLLNLFIYPRKILIFCSYHIRGVFNFLKNSFQYTFQYTTTTVFRFLMSDFLLLSDESTYYLYSFFCDFYFFCYLFVSEFLIFFFVYFLFFIFVLFISFFNFFIFGNFFALFLFYVFSVSFIILSILLIFLILFLINFFIFLIDFFFKISLSGLIFLSKDFLSIEDEDLWVSSNIFYLDYKIIQSDTLNVTLKAHEMDVFFTLITLFFDTQKINSGYFQYVLDLNKLSDLKDRKKYFRKLKKGIFNPSKELSGLKDRQRVYQKYGPSNISLDENLAGFYNGFFKTRGLLVFPLHLSRKKKLLQRRRLAKRNSNFFNFRDSVNLRKSRTKNSPSIHSRNQNLVNELILLKVLRSYKNFAGRNMVSFDNLKDKKFRDSSRFLNFFWFSFPFYLYNINYTFSLFNAIKLKHSFIFKKIYSRFFFLAYSFLFPSNNPSLYIRKNFFNFKDFSLLEKKTSQINLNKLIDSYLFVLLSEKENRLEDIDLEKQFDNVNNSELVDKRKSGKTQSDSEIIKKRTNVKRYYKRFSKKLNTSEYLRLVSKKNLKFVNHYDALFYKKYPKLKLLDSYKLLEYFYFVVTNDVDFYEGVAFAAKVAILRDKYGQAIVSDLLSKEDHKQAANVSVQLHYTSSEEIPTADLGGINIIVEKHPELPHFKNITKLNLDEKTQIRKKFRSNFVVFPSNISNFSKNLLLSYRYRFRS